VPPVLLVQQPPPGRLGLPEQRERTALMDWRALGVPPELLVPLEPLGQLVHRALTALMVLRVPRVRLE
jgi:hypothetical protein